MAKRYFHLWDQIVSYYNLFTAYHRAARGKRTKASVAGFEYNLEENIIQLRGELVSGEYRTGIIPVFISTIPNAD